MKPQLQAFTVWLNKSTAFFVRDFQIAASYKLQFFTRLAGGFIPILTFYFLSKLISDETINTAMSRYETDFFSFVLLGIATTGFLQVCLTGFSEKLRAAMTEGSLEMMCASPTSALWIVIFPCSWSLALETMRFVVFVSTGVLLLDAQVDLSGLPACALVVAATAAAYGVFGLLAAGIILIVKRGEPVTWLIAQISALLAGAYFPTELLPDTLGTVAKLLPITYAYHGVRMTLLTGASLYDVFPEILILMIFAVVGLPIALGVCARALKSAKMSGSLASF